MRQTLRLLVAAALLAGLAGCGQGAGGRPEPLELKVTTAGNAYDQKDLRVQAGRPVRLTLVNQDALLHDWSVDQVAVAGTREDGTSHGHADAAGKPALHVAAEAGATATLEFTPTAKGTYSFYCTVPGHRDIGMEGTLLVQ